VLAAANLAAQVPQPAAPQERPILLTKGTAHLGNGTVIRSANILFAHGKLVSITDASAPLPEGDHETIDIAGKHVYPGFILANSNLGLSEIGSISATNDTTERGDLNPNVRSIVAYNTDSELIPTLRFNGVLIAQVTPQGGLLSGSSSIVALEGWNWEDAVIKTDDGLHLNWPARNENRFDFTTFSRRVGPNKDYDKQVGALESLFNDARAYKNDPGRETNLKLAAMAGLWDGSRTLFIHTELARGIVEGVSFAKRHGVARMVLVGASEAMMVADFLKQQGIPVILSEIHRLPDNDDDDVDAPYKLPAQLFAEHIPFCLSYSSTMNARNLAFLAGTAAAYGLENEAALRAITLDAAVILGIASRVGSLEAGKDATLFVSTGDALDMRGNNVEMAFIAGRRLNLEGRQQILYERYKNKYGH